MPTSMPQNNTLHSVTENAVQMAMPIVATATALHEMDVNGYINMPWIQEVPGIDHASSFIGSWAVAAGITVGVEKLATMLKTRGHDKAAERMRRARNIIAWTGSIACQLAIETSSWGGVSDVRDVVAGAIATVPGIIYGSSLARFLSRDKTNPSHDIDGRI
jgi:hypothetical protein